MKTICLLSGGLDSTTLAAFLKSKGHELTALSVHYGQRHAKELEAAERIAAYLGIEWVQVDLGAIRGLFAGSGSSQVTDEAVPEGHYAESNMRSTVVPNRNMIMLSVAAALAISRKANAIAFAAHAGDHAIYPDCREAFVNAMRPALASCDYGVLHLLTPFLFETKADIAQRAAALRVPVEMTWSCYQGEAIHCGRCGTCVERAEAFSLAGVDDPTVYADSEFWKMAVQQAPAL